MRAADPINEWLSNNKELLAVVVGFAVALALLRAQVDALQAKFDKYPSEDYFELKFKTLDDGQKKLETLMNEHIKQYEERTNK